ncbi:D(1) dopamine receptor-like [Asterias amurensis]|uniref:D(1) dopamine receptor-like n=1 Tax=Asterias amurensis TaxID=7602 RepID=UPI003AB903FF
MDMNGTSAPPAEMEGGRTIAENAIIGIVLYAIVICSIVGNILVIVAVLSIRRLRSSITNYFIVSLAVADLMVSVLVMPFNASFEILGYWPFGLAFCDIYQAADILSATASILNLCVISLDRFMAITSPFTYYSRMNNRTAAILITTAWVVSFLISVLPVTLNLHEDEELVNIGWYTDPEFCVLAMNSTYALISSLISFYIPCVVILFTYARIYVVARRQARQIAAYDFSANRTKQDGGTASHRRMARERKAAKTLAIIVGVFILCWLPFFVANIIDPYCGHCIPPVLFGIFVWLGYINSFLNPFIYAQNKTFRNAFKSLLFCYRCRGINARDFETSDVDDRTAHQVSRIRASPRHEPQTVRKSVSDASGVYAVTNGAYTATDVVELPAKEPKTSPANEQAESPVDSSHENSKPVEIQPVDSPHVDGASVDSPSVDSPPTDKLPTVEKLSTVEKIPPQNASPQLDSNSNIQV